MTQDNPTTPESTGGRDVPAEAGSSPYSDTAASGPEHLPTTPSPVATATPDASPERRPLLQRTWVRVAGAAVAAVLLLGLGAGVGAAATAAGLAGSSVRGGVPGLLGGDDRGSQLQRPDGGPRGDLEGRDGDHRGDDDSDSDSDDGVSPAPEATP
ncbi:hypothetical protein QL996_12695 [Planococcus sp. APC 4015]|nr:hypothetical protein [Planococcus sp. APC 4015]